MKRSLFLVAQKLRLWGLIEFFRLWYNFNRTYGFFQTANNWSSIDKAGNPIPWMTFSSISYLDTLEMKKMSVFEWGSGNSTIYFAKKAKSIISVENNRSWYDKVQKMIQERNIQNCKLNYLKQKEDYISHIGSLGKKFDIIIVDASYRMDCLKKAKSFLKSKGMVILDNQERYPEVDKLFPKSSFLRVSFKGFGPINSYPWVTTIYFKK